MIAIYLLSLLLAFVTYALTKKKRKNKRIIISILVFIIISIGFTLVITYFVGDPPPKDSTPIILKDGKPIF